MNKYQKISLISLTLSFSIFCISSYAFTSRAAWSGNIFVREVLTNVWITNYLGIVALGIAIASLASYFILKDK